MEFSLNKDACSRIKNLVKTHESHHKVHKVMENEIGSKISYSDCSNVIRAMCGKKWVANEKKWVDSVKRMKSQLLAYMGPAPSFREIRKRWNNHRHAC